MLTEKHIKENVKFEEELKERMDSGNMPSANIIVAGITGTGKSTLINSIFGSDLAPTGTGMAVTTNMNEYQNPNIPIHIWDTVGLELDSAKTEQSIKSIKDTIASKTSLKDIFDRIHAIWYCINSGSRRYQGAELDFIKELYSFGVPFIIVLTQCDGDEKEINSFEKFIKNTNNSIGLTDIPIVQVLAKASEFNSRGASIIIPEFGLNDLVKITLDRLPDFIKSSFSAAQRISKLEKRKECEKIISDYVDASLKGFWDKIPIIQVLTTDKTIRNMFLKIGRMYNTILPIDSVDKIRRECSVTFSNKFLGLMSPNWMYRMGYSKKITKVFELKKEEGLSVTVVELSENERVARMIAYFGYIFMDSIEDLWEDLTEEQLKNIDLVYQKLIDNINEKLRETEEGFKHEKK